MKKSIRKNAGRSIEVDWQAVAVIGIDLGDRISQFVALDNAGQRVAEGRVPTTVEAFEQRFGAIGAKVVAIETGTHSPIAVKQHKEASHCFGRVTSSSRPAPV
ncbi:MAG TPA: hypothetical protein VKB93_04900 [Thermoanaerobaculia bacterium]|nr:hypothetical protein [Thermoanaerobaculia bacterium]